MGSRVELHLDQAALRRMLTGPSGEAVRLVRRAQRATMNQGRLRAPVDTGFLRSTHQATGIHVTGLRVTAEVEATADYAAGVHEGTRPHIIRPRRARALAWQGPSGLVVARSVRHPGSRPRPWLLNAARAGAGRLGFTVTPGG
ncbi:hypothetical protein [Corynebacterium sphenisci]|uniref:hypothetical protein n=1 Tax=Corynebacterium sphenisci TaxID=191493 RepID=UPI0026E1039D|nr:hypothetical protein [Corynebacterium sphenisci]MDO5730783.1 hypothetical protein [Corynebacterium sphenisci]